MHPVDKGERADAVGQLEAAAVWSEKAGAFDRARQEAPELAEALEEQLLGARDVAVLAEIVVDAVRRAGVTGDPEAVPDLPTASSVRFLCPPADTPPDQDPPAFPI